MWLEKKYIQYLSGTLDRYKQKSENLWNFRCPYCLDSKSNKSKARGYIFLRKGQYYYYCHNCHKSLGFVSFLKNINSALYNEYTMEKFNLIENKDVEEKRPEPVQIYTGMDNLKTLKKVSQLPPNHVCKKYVIERHIPSEYHYRLYYCPNFKKWTNTIIVDKFKNQDIKDDARLIIPLMDDNDILIGYQGRALDKNNDVRYITIMLDETKPRLFGLNTTNFNQKYYVFEGPFDSMFIPNSIAACGGMISSELYKAKKPKENGVIVYDNEPRNVDIIENIKRSIYEGYKVCIWPVSFETKDINDYVIDRMKSNYCKYDEIKKVGIEIKAIIDNNTFSGLDAELKLASWRKI